MRFDLTVKQAQFARKLFEGLNQTEAYRAVYNVENMSDSSVYGAAYQLSNHPQVSAYVAKMQEDANIVAQLNVAWVLRRYMDIAVADPNELIESRRESCRYCYGVGHAWQWIDEAEFAAELAEVIDFNARQANTRKERCKPLPTADGGFGYWKPKAPHPDCPKCFGKGVLDVHIHDSRKLSPTARALYAGIKQTQNGVEIKMRNQDGALEFLARYLGLDKKTVELSGPGGGPVQTLSTTTTDPLEAAKVYAQIMAGKGLA